MSETAAPAAPAGEPENTPTPPAEPAPAVAPTEPAQLEGPKPTPPPVKPADEWKPPTKAEYEELARKLKDSNAESAARRKKLEAFERERETEQEKAIREAVEAANAATKPRIVKAEARSALASADARPERITALLKFLDMDKINLDGDNVTGLDAEVTRVKDEYPEFFKADKPEEPATPPTPKVTVGSKKPADTPRTAGEKIAASLNNR